MPAATEPLTPERRALAAELWPLARGIALGWARSYPRLADDLESAAAAAAVEAAATPLPRGTDRRTHLGRVVRCDLADVVREARRRRRLGRATDPGALDRRAAPAGRRPPERAEAAARLAATLPAELAATLRLLYREGLTARAAAARLGVTPPAVSRRRKRALTLLRESLAA